MTSAIKGAGTTLKIGATTVAEVVSIGPIGSTATEVDVTNLDSTSKEYIGGLPDSDAFDFTVNWIAGNTQQEQLRDAVGGSAISMSCVWPDTTNAAFNFVVLGFGLGETTADGAVTATISGRISGSITWT